MVLMGAMGVRFPLSEGIDAVWGYTPSIPNMRRLLDIFAYNRELVSDELAELRYKASIRPGMPLRLMKIALAKYVRLRSLSTGEMTA
jgi:hypothetical protein